MKLVASCHAPLSHSHAVSLFSASGGLAVKAHVFDAEAAMQISDSLANLIQQAGRLRRRVAWFQG